MVFARKSMILDVDKLLKKWGEMGVDNVDKTGIEHNFCAICQVYHKEKYYVILKSKKFVNKSRFS